MGRGRGKGGRHRNVTYVASAEQIERRNAKDAEWQARRNARRGIEKAQEHGGDSSSEEEDAAVAASDTIRQGGAGKDGDQDEVDELTRQRLAALKLLEAEKEEAAAAGVSEVLAEGVENLNRNRKANIKVNQIQVNNVPQTRKDREREEAARRKADYDRRHAAGETEQAKKDLARLREVQARRKAAAEGRKAMEATNAAQKGSSAGRSDDSDSDSDSDSSSSDSGSGLDSDSDSGAAAGKKKKKKKKKEKKKKEKEKPVFSKVQVKKMNPTKMKSLLKELGESTQGNKKQLLARLLPHASS